MRDAGSTSPVTRVLVGTAGVGAAYSGRVGAALAEQGGPSIGSLTPQVLATLPTSASDVVRLAFTDALTPVLRALVPVAAMAAVLLVFLRPVPQGDHRDRAWSDD